MKNWKCPASARRTMSRLRHQKSAERAAAIDAASAPQVSNPKKSKKDE